MNSIWTLVALVLTTHSWGEDFQDREPAIRFSLMGGGMRPWSEVRVSSPLGASPDAEEVEFSKTVYQIVFSPSSGTVLETQRGLQDSIQNAATPPSLNARLRALSNIGRRLVEDYDHDKASKLKNTSEQFVLDTARNATFGDGGICGPIHSLLTRFQRSLGFEHVGMHSVLWKQDRNQVGDTAQAGGHALSHFRDPATGRYYVQNYDVIVDLNTTDFREALERSLALHSPLTGMSYVESREGRVHQHQGNRSRWIHGQLNRAAFYGPSGANLEINLSNLQQSAGFNYGWEVGQGMLRVFAGHTRFDGSNGQQNLTYLGAALEAGKELEIGTGPLDSLFMNLRTFAAAHRFATPRLSPESRKNGEEWERYSGAFGIETQGRLKMGPLTPKAEIALNMLDIGNLAENDASRPYHHLEGGLEIAVPKVPFLSFELTRRIHVVPRDLRDDRDLTLRTVFDYGGIIIDSRGVTGSDTIYLVNRAGVFVLEGFGNIAGFAVRNLLELVVRTGRYGDFFANADITMVLDNAQDDPIYGKERELAYTVRFGYRYPITENLTLGLGAGMRSQNQGLHFLRSEVNRPDLQSGDENYFIEGGLELQFSRNRRPRLPDSAYRLPREALQEERARPRRLELKLLNRGVDRRRSAHQRVLITRMSDRGYTLQREELVPEGVHGEWKPLETRFAPSFEVIERALLAIPGFDRMYAEANPNSDWRVAIQSAR